MEILQNFYFIFVLLSYLVCLTRALPNIVTLKVRGVDCADTCFYNKDKNECYSSIKVNEQEKSLQEDGLNVAVIDTSSGNVKQKHFSSLFDLFSYRRKKKFLNFFKNINESSIVVIASQDMCALYYSGWYKLLTKNTNIFKKNAWRKGAQVGLSIGCQGDCPVLLNGSLPYSYFGFEASHEITLVFRLKSVPTTTTQPTRRKVTTSTKPLTTSTSTQAKTKNDTSLIIAIVITVAILAIVAFLMIIWLRVKKGKDVCKICMVCLTSRTDNKNSNNNTEDESGSVKLFNNESYGIQANVLPLTPVTQPCNGKKNCRLQAEYQNTKNEYQAVTEKNVEYSRAGAATEINEYAYIDPKNDKNLSADNNYYMPGRSEIDCGLADLESSSQVCKRTKYDSAEYREDCSENTLYEKPLINQDFNPFSLKQQNVERRKPNSHFSNTPSVYQPLSVHTDIENMYETLNNPQ
ncbi:uncharacterized protein LOC130640962 [Hydractinia symbiolongicarpus]|uniref:uncharacterized protein LOC130640962 n=1 Tax=Hydractinia symbiolongicarpus TaxID=13093 RepID=UPI00254D01CE|nr:uncharacterized protein LOC130640962 [Hydractinia symbiolongicarpus]